MGDAYRSWLRRRLVHYEKQRALDREHAEKQQMLNDEYYKLMAEEPPKES